jgi:hypothetical protein
MLSGAQPLLPRPMKKHAAWYSAALVAAAAVAALAALAEFSPAISFVRSGGEAADPPPKPVLDKVAYDTKLLDVAHVATSSPWYYAFLAGTTTPLDAEGNATTTKAARPLWPVRTVYPDAGALLPFNRIVAYYGNFYSTGMGVLGEYPPQEMLQKLASTTEMWQKADPSTPVIPAIHYIVETAQGSAGKDGDYMARMPDDQIDKALALAAQVHGLVFLDFQVGFSTVQKELPQYAKYLALPNVHVGIDPEFSMKDHVPPGREIGTFDAADINWVANYLAKIVRDNDLPPKILIVHRFTEEMVTNYKRITPLPEVQIVMDMDGWGGIARKENTYNTVIAPEPVQFTGFKLFYKNDLKEEPPRMMTPAEVLGLTPAPLYIQYQ